MSKSAFFFAEIVFFSWKWGYFVFSLLKPAGRTVDFRGMDDVICSFVRHPLKNELAMSQCNLY